ncbi:MAG TPA: hypothetical protein VHG30_16865 [Microvirga sp.]|jgi:hypothetical protein|nr:hypothetical protein [Microvirga sp.]
MEHSVLLLWAGAFLFIAGVLYTTAKALGRDRLSEPRSSGSGPSGRTLEPREPGGGLRLQENWPGLALIALGSLLLLVGAVI